MFDFWRPDPSRPDREPTGLDRELMDDSFVETVLAGAGLEVDHLRSRPIRTDPDAPRGHRRAAIILQAARSIA